MRAALVKGAARPVDDPGAGPAARREGALEPATHRRAQPAQAGFGIGLAGEVLLGQPHRAERQRHDVLHQPADGQDQLEAAAADVGHDAAAPHHGEVLPDREKGEPGLGLAVDHLERDADLVLDPPRELGAH